MKVRVSRIALQMQREISEILRTELKDPRVGFVTVTAVELSSDMTHAKVFVSVLGPAADRQATLEVLERARGYVRSEVGQRIRLRVTPEIHFKLDESMEYSAHIGKVLGRIHEEDEKRAVHTHEDSHDG